MSEKGGLNIRDEGDSHKKSPKNNMVAWGVAPPVHTGDDGAGGPARGWVGGGGQIMERLGLIPGGGRGGQI